MQLSIIFNDLSPFFGRFHPLFIHLPIGFIVIAYLLEFVGKTDRRSYLKLSVPFVLLLGSISSVFAVATGYILSQTESYGADAIFWHQWSGIAVTILIFITLLIRKSKIYFILFSCSVIGIFVTGHLGGNITHGETYLTEYLPEELKDVFGIETDNYVMEQVTYEEALLFRHLVYPILHNKCVSCHNDAKMKGELNMKDFNSFLQGGENGEVILKGNVKSSDMIKRILLSESHEDAMPPEGKERIDEEELKLISLWIDQDFKEDTHLDSLEISEDLMEDIHFRLRKKEEELSPVFQLEVPEVDEQKLENIRKYGFTVLPLKKGSPFLQVAYFDRGIPLTEESKLALMSVAEQLVWLDLTGVKSVNNDWLMLESFPNLIKLYLSNTTVTNQTIIALSKNKYLESVSLFGTFVSKEILKPLMELEHLNSIYVGNTNIQVQDTVALQLNPRTKIIF